MPSKSLSQARLMQAVAHNKGFAKKVGIPQNVGREFAAADAAKGTKMKAKGYGMARGAKRTQKFAEGGETGRFDEDTYARARKFVESGGSDEEETPKVEAKARSESKPKAAAKPKSSGTPAGTGAAMRRSSSTGTPAGTGSAMRKEDDWQDALSDARKTVERTEFVPGMGGGRTFSALKGIGGRGATAALEGPKAAGKGLASPSVAPRLSGPSSSAAKAEAEVVTPKRAPARMTTKPASSRRKANSDELNKAMRSRSADDMYAKGGSVRGGGIEQRGKTKGTMR